MSKPKVSLKLLIDTKNQKVMFAEAGKDFVDFLFTLLALPIGTVVRLLKKNGMVGALGTLYNGVENLNEIYIRPNVSKDTILNPKLPIGVANPHSSMPFLPLPARTADGGSSSLPKKMYTCGSHSCSLRSVSEAPLAVCPSCNHYISKEVRYVKLLPAAGLPSGEGGYVNGVMTYMIMDDLEVKPMSTISSISMLNKFNVGNFGDLEERTVSLGMNEGLKLLNASLHSQTVLTDVYMPIKKSTRKRQL